MVKFTPLSKSQLLGEVKQPGFHFENDSDTSAKLTAYRQGGQYECQVKADFPFYYQVTIGYYGDDNILHITYDGHVSANSLLGAKISTTFLLKRFGYKPEKDSK